MLGGCAPPGSIAAIVDPRERLLAFARERHAIYLRRQDDRPVQRTAGGDSVWTNDPILREYRFCNIYRELDTVTRWIADYWRGPHAADPDLWFAMVVARFVNWPDTLGLLGYPVPWDGLKFKTVVAHLQTVGRKAYSGAYMIRSDKEWAGRPKADYLVEMQFNPLWQQREVLRPRAGDTLNSYHMTLGQMYGMGSFMAAQVVADLKYVEPLMSASDWWTFAASGPGSRRGLNRVLGLPKDNPWREDEWRLANERLRGWFNDRWEHEPLHGQDMQNALCEFDKMERVRCGEGRPRAKYHPRP